jgi:hypothetical protein
MPNYRWRPIGTLPMELQHLNNDTAAQRYLGSTSISILRCAAQNVLERAYGHPKNAKILQGVKDHDDGELFERIINQTVITNFCNPANGLM